MPDDREYELKFSMSPDAVELVVSHPLLRAALPKRRIDRLVSTYFDTPEALLARHRFGLRVRRGDSGVTHTLKQSTGSTIDRGEWERDDPRPRPDPAWLARTPLAAHASAEELARLEERFVVEVERTSLPLKGRRGTVEAALDQGAIRAGGLVLRISELELEHKRGKRKAVTDLARRLVKDLPLTLSLTSKSQRGHELRDLTWGRPRRTIDVRLAPRDPLARSFATAMEGCLHVLLENLALVDGADSVEAVHQSRIALRHIRALLYIYKPVLRRRRRSALLGDVRWLSRKLGEARDADVFQETIFKPMAGADTTLVGAVELSDWMEARRQKAHVEVVEALAGTRARQLFLSMLDFSTRGVRKRYRDDDTRMYLRWAFARRRRQLARKARRLASQSSAHQHRVRKSAKMLRYACDLCAGAKLGAQRSRKRRKLLKVLQQTLGVVHDEIALREYLKRTILDARRGRAEGEVPSRAVFAAADLVARPISRAAELRRAQKAADRL